MRREAGPPLAEELRALAGGKVDLVVSPALGGVIIGHEVARALGTRFLFTERDAATGKMTLRRGFTAGPGETAVVVEDVVTTGGSTRDVVDALRAAGAAVAGGGFHYRPQRRRGRRGCARASRWPRCKWWPTVPTHARCAREGIPVVKPGSRPA